MHVHVDVHVHVHVHVHVSYWKVVLLYVAASRGTLAPTEPAAALVRSLVAFERVGPIAPGASATVRFALSPEMVKVADARGVRMLRPGGYTFVASTGLAERALPFTCDLKACRASAEVTAEAAPPQLVEAA